MFNPLYSVFYKVLNLPPILNDLPFKWTRLNNSHVTVHPKSNSVGKLGKVIFFRKIEFLLKNGCKEIDFGHAPWNRYFEAFSFKHYASKQRTYRQTNPKVYSEISSNENFMIAYVYIVLAFNWYFCIRRNIICRSIFTHQPHSSRFSNLFTQLCRITRLLKISLCILIQKNVYKVFCKEPDP